jgi:hypothetical protein
MSEFVKKTMIGYKEVPGGQSDPECTHVILPLKEYDGLLQKISQAEQETRNEKRRAEEEKRDSLNREQQTIQKANQVIEKWMKALEKEKAESAYQKGLNENLLRIARERANADRKLKPKKEHSGYVVVVSAEKIYRYKIGRRLESVKLWETVIQSPYSIEFPAKQVKRLILEEFFPETGEWEAARLGIERWVAGDYEDFLSAADKDEELMQQNTALTGYRSFRANYRAGYWEMILVHTRPLEVVPKDMRVS